MDCFVSGLHDEDVLVMPEPVYFGGTTDRSVGSREIISEIERHGRKACLPTAAPVATPWSGWPVAAIASGSWARATICFRNSHRSFFDGLAASSIGAGDRQLADDAGRN